MTSFGATEIVKNNAANGQQYHSTFKIKGQIYHKVGALLSMPNEPHTTFLQIYLMDSEDSESAFVNRKDARCRYNITLIHLLPAASSFHRYARNKSIYIIQFIWQNIVCWVS